MEQGPVEERIIDQCMREGLPLPKRIQEAPQIHLGLGLYYSAFKDLSTSRPIGMAEGQVPWHIIEQWATVNKLSEDQKDDLHYFVREMDGTYLQFRQKQRENSSGNKLPRKNAT